jgi:hypothetical protein
VSDFEDDFEEMADPAPASLATGTGPTGLTLEDLCAYAPSRSCIYLPCKSPWPNASVDERLPPMPLLDAGGKPVLNAKGKVVMLAASEWLAKNRSVEAMTWAPGEPEFIRGKLAVDGGWVDKDSATSLNLYRPPPDLELGDAAQATRWVEHWRTLYPDGADHIITWLACRVQRPREKINHALLGKQQRAARSFRLLRLQWLQLLRAWLPASAVRRQFCSLAGAWRTHPFGPPND